MASGGVQAALRTSTLLSQFNQLEDEWKHVQQEHRPGSRVRSRNATPLAAGRGEGGSLPAGGAPMLEQQQQQQQQARGPSRGLQTVSELLHTPGLGLYQELPAQPARPGSLPTTKSVDSAKPAANAANKAPAAMAQSADAVQHPAGKVRPGRKQPAAPAAKAAAPAANSNPKPAELPSPARSRPPAPEAAAAPAPPAQPVSKIPRRRWSPPAWQDPAVPRSAAFEPSQAQPAVSSWPAKQPAALAVANPTSDPAPGKAPPVLAVNSPTSPGHHSPGMKGNNNSRIPSPGPHGNAPLSPVQHIRKAPSANSRIPSLGAAEYSSKFHDLAPDSSLGLSNLSELSSPSGPSSNLSNRPPEVPTPPRAVRAPQPPAKPAAGGAGGAGFRRHSSNAGSQQTSPAITPRSLSPEVPTGAPAAPDLSNSSLEGSQMLLPTPPTNLAPPAAGSTTAAPAAAPTVAAPPAAGDGLGDSDANHNSSLKMRDPAYIRKLSALKRGPLTADQLINYKRKTSGGSSTIPEEGGDHNNLPSPPLPGGPRPQQTSASGLPTPGAGFRSGGAPDDLPLRAHARRSSESGAATSSSATLTSPAGSAAVKAAMLASGASPSRAALAALAATRPGSRGRAASPSRVGAAAAAAPHAGTALSPPRRAGGGGSNHHLSNSFDTDSCRVASPVVLGMAEGRSRPGTSAGGAGVPAPTSTWTGENHDGFQVTSEMLVVLPGGGEEPLSGNGLQRPVGGAAARAGALAALAKQRSHVVAATNALAQQQQQQQQQQQDANGAPAATSPNGASAGVVPNTAQAAAAPRQRAKWQVAVEEPPRDVPPPGQSASPGSDKGGVQRRPSAGPVAPAAPDQLPSWAQGPAAPIALTPPPQNLQQQHQQAQNMQQQQQQQYMQQQQQQQPQGPLLTLMYPYPQGMQQQPPPPPPPEMHPYMHPGGMIDWGQQPPPGRMMGPGPPPPQQQQQPFYPMGGHNQMPPPPHMMGPPPMYGQMGGSNGHMGPDGPMMPPWAAQPMGPGMGMPMRPGMLPPDHMGPMGPRGMGGSGSLGMPPMWPPPMAQLPQHPGMMPPHMMPPPPDFGGAGPGWANKDRRPGVPVPMDVPDYMRMSMSKYTTGWAANPREAAAGPLSAFADVWRQRHPQNMNGGPPGNMQPPGMQPPQPNQPPYNRQPPLEPMYERRQQQQTAFEGMSLAEVLASAPKKDPPPFVRNKKTGAPGPQAPQRAAGGDE